MTQIESLQNEIARLNKIIEQKIAALVRPSVEAEGLKLLQNGGYILPDDPTIRTTRLEILFDKMEDDNTKLRVENGKIIVTDASGQPKENETGTRYVLFDELLESKARITFERHASDKRQSPANGATYNKNLGDMSHLQTTEDFFKALNEETDPVKQKEIKALFDRSMKHDSVTQTIN